MAGTFRALHCLVRRRSSSNGGMAPSYPLQRAPWSSIMRHGRRIMAETTMRLRGSETCFLIPPRLRNCLQRCRSMVVSRPGFRLLDQAVVMKTPCSVATGIRWFKEQCVRSRMPRRLPFSKTWICPVLPLLMTAWQRIPRVTSTNRAGSMSSAEQRGGCNCGNRQDWNMVVVVASRAAGRKTEAGNLRRSVATYGRCMRVVRMRSGMPSCSGDPCIGRSINI